MEEALRTTNSRHSLPAFRNLAAAMELTGFNQARISDIAHIRTEEGFLYLSLITDDWSRTIVRYHTKPKVALTAIMRKLIIAANSAVKNPDFLVAT